ncbi:MAG: hypothetical protein AAGL98_04225, partial [Planctomycetota bacterium]
TMNTNQTDFFPVAARLALELECLLLSCKDTAAVSKWWDSAHEALQQFRDASQAEPVGDEPIAKLNATQLRWLKDGIRNAYDTGYSDARNAHAVPGDNAPGYRGRHVEKESGEHYAGAIERAAMQRAGEEAMSNMFGGGECAT